MATEPLFLPAELVPINEGNVAPMALRRLKAFCQIWVGGQDVTSRFDPHLLTVKIIDKLLAIDEATITLDDRWGSLAIPKNKEPLRIGLGWRGDAIFFPFEGTVNDVEHYGQKTQGRNMQIEGKGISFLDKAKEPVKQTWEEDQKGEGVELGKVLEEAAKAAGFGNIEIDENMRKIKRPSWMMTGESFLNFAARIGREVGGLPKMANQNGQDTFSFSDAASGKSASGHEMGTILVRTGPNGNLIGWRIKPQAARAQWKGATSEWFDANKSTWDRTIKEITGGAGGWFGGATAGFVNGATQANEGAAKAQSGADGDDSFKQRGTGWVVIDGEPRATAGSFIQLKGIRHGVDGRYRIKEAEHSYSRRGGYTTRLDIDQPQISGDLSQEWDVPSGGSTAPPDDRTPGSTGTPETGY
jgi:phage protein D